ncbi:uncharacterized protein LOC101459186 isoform X2 [Ceratitis capitata]|uniref:uncharacterized protein LOC101459186 isoform X1 n=1 Tax=Ceratitis capitata TaxID=7213 RepID=UPI000329E05A|nr:uncharacterized protein LOC101459186 isoform X1 [Ceratitis capitata]XP_023159336.1 uncharacterized protein LOC101459186 isoform X2 [Ceratitis capitata]
MLIKRLCCCAALTIFTNCVFGAPAANKTQRLKRQIFSNDFNFNNNNNNPFFRPTANSFEPNPFARPQWGRPGPGQPLIFSNGGNRQSPTITSTTTTTTPPTSNGDANVVFINNQPIVATIPPFTAPTTATPQFLDCFGNCPTTSEYNPICASNQQQYQNPQKFDCARRCGADIQIVRRGACEGLFPMSRG